MDLMDILLSQKLNSGGGGTSNYSELSNKPQINNVELDGNKTAHDLGLAAQSDIPTVPVQSVNGKTGAVVLSATDVGAKPDSYTAPVSSVNNKTGAVSLASGDIGYDESATYQAGSVGAELSNQSRHLSDLQPAATSADVGKALIVKTVDTQTGKPTSYEYGEAGGGTSNYSELSNKPQINGHTLTGNQTAAQLDLAASSDVPKKTSDLTNDSNFITGMTILFYGRSTWADFLAAYKANRVVYCRAPSADSGTGTHGRFAFMAFVNFSGSTPTFVEFQYYRSVSSHTAAQQGDQVFIYTLKSNGTWSVETREASTAIAAGTNLSQSYSNGTLTLSFDGTGYIAAPATAGTAGQVLGLNNSLNPVWVNQSGGGGMNIVNLSGTQITQVGADNTFYVCGELTELTFTAPAVGITMIRFTSGTTPTVLTVNGVTSWMFDNDPTTDPLEANKTYDINVLNGVGVVGWA